MMYTLLASYVSTWVQFPQHAAFAAPRGAYVLQLLCRSAMGLLVRIKLLYFFALTSHMSAR